MTIKCLEPTKELKKQEGREVMKQALLGALYLSIAAGIWGGMFVASKYALDYIPPFTLMVFRYLIGCAVLFSILKWSKVTRPSKTKKDWLLLIWIGFIGYLVTISFQFIGVHLADAHTASLLTATTPIFLVLFARIILKEAITVRKVIALLLAVTGVIIVIEWNTGMGDYLTGSIILIMAAISWALLSVYVKVASSKFSSLEITGYGIFFGMLMTVPFMIWELQTTNIETLNLATWTSVIYLGIVATAGGFFLWNKGMALMEAGVGSLFYFFQPLVGSVLGWLLLGEELTVNFFIGFLFIMCGIGVTTLGTRRKENEISQIKKVSEQSKY